MVVIFFLFRAAWEGPGRRGRNNGLPGREGVSEVLVGGGSEEEACVVCDHEQAEALPHKRLR